mgnify:CR=1 FL=1
MRPARTLFVCSLVMAGCASSNRLPAVNDSGVDGAPPFMPGPGDAFPTGAISFFKAMICPEGWDSLPVAANRFLVPTVGVDKIGAVAGVSLMSGEDRTHIHPIAANVTLRSISYAGIAGEANHGVAAAAAVKFQTTSEAASAGLPYVQLRVCKKSAAPKAFPTPLPRGTLLFFDTQACPAGWTQATATQGRFLVGLPARGVQGATFGGAALSAQEERVHTHPVQGSFSTKAQGITLASGCCASGYAENGMYTFQATSDAGPAGLPYVQLLQCQKN